MPQFPANIDLSSLDGTTGFKLAGAAAGDRSGRSVASSRRCSVQNDSGELKDLSVG